MMDKLTINAVRSCLNQLQSPTEKAPLGDSQSLQVAVREDVITLIIELPGQPSPAHEELRTSAVKLVQERFPQIHD